LASITMVTLITVGLWWKSLAGALIGLVATKYISAALTYIFLEIEVRRALRNPIKTTL
jgi:hypothetical protein